MSSVEEFISSLKLDGLFDVLQKKVDFESKIQITLQAIENHLPLNLTCEQKNSEKSINLRQTADNLIIKRKGSVKSLFDALELYSKSISIAENSSTALAQAFANRSAVLFNLSKFSECINDIERALQINYPDHLKANLLRRKAKCLKILGNSEFNNICEEARTMLENVNISHEKREKIEMKIKKVSTYEYKKGVLEDEISLPNITYNKTIPSASEAIAIQYNDDIGRHLVATRDISVGELLITEKPYAQLLCAENIYTHCSHCFLRTWDSIPCENCIQTMYCSKKCKNEAWKEYHDIECPIKGYFIAMKINDLAPFSLKLTILAIRESGGISKLRQTLEDIDNCKDYLTKSMSDDGIYYSNRYKPLFSLLTHETNRKLYEILPLSLNAAITLYFMYTLTNYFGKTSNKSLAMLYNNKDAIFIGKLIAHNTMVIQMNDYEFSEFQHEENIRIGSAIGAVTSLLNHSCHPNVGRCCVIRNKQIEQVVYALYPIEKGSEITENYGCHFLSLTKSEREKKLMSFHMKCSCVACNENWPLKENLPSILSLLKDKEEQIEVSRAIVRSKEPERIIFNVGFHKNTGDKRKVLSSLIKSIDVVYEIIRKPSKEYFELLELFQQAFLRIYGNRLKL